MESTENKTIFVTITPEMIQAFFLHAEGGSASSKRAWCISGVIVTTIVLFSVDSIEPLYKTGCQYVNYDIGIILAIFGY